MKETHFFWVDEVRAWLSCFKFILLESGNWHDTIANCSDVVDGEFLVVVPCKSLNLVNFLGINIQNSIILNDEFRRSRESRDFLNNLKRFDIK